MFGLPRAIGPIQHFTYRRADRVGLLRPFPLSAQQTTHSGCSVCGVRGLPAGQHHRILHGDYPGICRIL